MKNKDREITYIKKIDSDKWQILYKSDGADAYLFTSDLVSWLEEDVCNVTVTNKVHDEILVTDKYLQSMLGSDYKHLIVEVSENIITVHTVQLGFSIKIVICAPDRNRHKFTMLWKDFVGQLHIEN